MHGILNQASANNSNNVSLVPLKQGESPSVILGGQPLFSTDRDDVNGTRRPNSPLPAVPLPIKKSKLSSRTHASCDDLTRLSPVHNNSIVETQCTHLNRAASVDFDAFNKSISLSQPLLAESLPAERNQFPLRNFRYTESSEKYTPVHDYEELKEHSRQQQVKISQDRHQPNNCEQFRYQPMTSQPATGQLAQPPSPKPTINSQYPRTRQNPMYSSSSPGNHYGNFLSESVYTKRHSVISNNCACALVVGLVVSIIISVLSIVIVVLFAFGVVGPLDLTENDVNSRLADLTEALSHVRDELKDQSSETAMNSQKFNDTLNRLQEEITSVFQNKSNSLLQEEIRRQVSQVIGSMSPEQIQDIILNLSGSVLSHCRHETYAIGISPSQELSDSGEYYAEEGHVITGATCSSANGFVASLESRVDERKQTRYKCKCLKVSSSTAPSIERVECRIHYWECATMTT